MAPRNASELSMSITAATNELIMATRNASELIMGITAATNELMMASRNALQQQLMNLLWIQGVQVIFYGQCSIQKYSNSLYNVL